MTIKISLAAALVALTSISAIGGCISQVDFSAYDSPCAEANARMSDCFVDDTNDFEASASASAPALMAQYETQASAFPAECARLSLCEAGCINRASCDQLKDVHSETPTAVSTSYASCVSACSSSQ
jgi:hypothetical protein